MTIVCKVRIMHFKSLDRLQRQRHWINYCLRIQETHQEMR